MGLGLAMTSVEDWAIMWTVSPVWARFVVLLRAYGPLKTKMLLWLFVVYKLQQ